MTNPFAWQAEWAQLWLGTASAITRATTDSWLAVGRATMDFWTGGASRGIPFATAPLAPTMPWPFAMPQYPAMAPFAGFGGVFAQPFPMWPMAPVWPAWSAMTVPGWTPMTWGWPLATGLDAARSWGQMSGFAPHPAAALLESAATAYRSASGYAVATVLAPFDAAVRARGSEPTSPFGWWMSLPPSRTRH